MKLEVWGQREEELQGVWCPLPAELESHGVVHLLGRNCKCMFGVKAGRFPPTIAPLVKKQDCLKASSVCSRPVVVGCATLKGKAMINA